MSEHIRARKSLGQNFLVDTGTQRRIVDALDLQPDDTVVEIGPGQGALTQHLVELAARVIVVELDDRLAPLLRERFAAYPGFTLIHGDALEFDPRDHGLDAASLKMVGNIPYNITTPLLFHLLERERRPERLVVMVQKEVATRITAPPGGSDYGALTVGIQSVAATERLFTVPRGAFRPVPGVDSAVVRITPLVPPRLGAQEEIDLRTLTRTMFAWRRKQVQKILRASPLYELPAEVLQTVLAESETTPDARPETLAPDRFIALARSLRNQGFPREHVAT